MLDGLVRFDLAVPGHLHTDAAATGDFVADEDAPDDSPVDADIFAGKLFVEKHRLDFLDDVGDLSLVMVEVNAVDVDAVDGRECSLHLALPPHDGLEVVIRVAALGGFDRVVAHGVSCGSGGGVRPPLITRLTMRAVVGRVNTITTTGMEKTTSG